MPPTALDLITSIGKRVRDENNTAHTSAFVRDIIDRVQTILNAKQEYVLTTLPLVTVPGQALYSVENDLSGMIKVDDIRQNGVPLAEVPWRNLWKLSNTWLTADRDTPTGWAKIGMSLIAIYPAPDSVITYQVEGVKITNALSADSTPLELRDEDADIVKEIVITLLLFRQRDLDTGGLALSRADDKAKLQLEEFMEQGLRKV